MSRVPRAMTREQRAQVVATTGGKGQPGSPVPRLRRAYAGACMAEVQVRERIAHDIATDIARWRAALGRPPMPWEKGA